ncbi:PP2C family protein-serine/threonine phosphatase [Streptomyces mirabilis]|uniref:PP2C family protein-serine/threonine phosphatase n=1 Tax=Streptomyces mirabilis TaxID=68239 RepID=UPI00224C94F1|nr:SpoIIE family protein phosphatase [Streptomyces mirabilis]MCX4609451.1 SpoIIE family protein phosphatase [Streptomyces mirabilis]
MRSYATAQNVGGRGLQCDATAVRTAPDGTRAYVVLDGIGTSETIRDWTRKAAARLAARAARRGDAESALRALYEEIAADPDRQDPYERRYLPSAAAVVAVVAPGQPLTVAWAGDSRAYLLRRGIAHRLTDDHNLRRVYPPTATHPDGGNRNMITSYLGAVATDEECRGIYGHPAIETAARELADGDRLVLATDGAYEPHEEAGHDLYVELEDDELTGTARRFVDLAVEASRKSRPENEHRYVDNATVLVAELTA